MAVYTQFYILAPDMALMDYCRRLMQLAKFAMGKGRLRQELRVGMLAKWGLEMKLRKIAVLAALAFGTFAPASYANTFAYLSAGPASLVPGVTTANFGTSGTNDSSPVVNPLAGYAVGPATYQGGELFNMSTTGISGVSARPVGSTGNFWSIQAGETGTVSFTTGVSYYGFLWGSPDVSPWNTVTFKDSASNVIGTYGGLDTNLSNDWGNTTYFNVTSNGGPLIWSVVFTATQNAFETDNHSFIAPTTVVTTVPEPETYAMLLAGLGLLGFAARRRKQKETVAA